MGKYQVGFETDGIRTDEHYTAIYKDNVMICSFPNDEAKEVAKLMYGWLYLNELKSYTDEQLFDELKKRNYTGVLHKKFEI